MSTSETKEIQGAEIIELPGAKNAPIHNHRHHGRYPQGVVSLRKLRIEKIAADRREAAKRENDLYQAKRAAVRALNDLMARALDGKLDGFVYLLEERENKQQKVVAVGRYSNDLSLALTACERGGDIIREHIAQTDRVDRDVQD